MFRARNSDSKTHQKKWNPTPGTDFRLKSLWCIFFDAPCTCTYVLTRFLVTNAYFSSWMLTFDMLFIIFRNLDNHAKVYKYRLYLLYLSLLSLLSSPCAARRACALRALGLLLADGAPTVGRVKTFWRVNRFFFFTKTAVTPERKVEKSFPRSEINCHAEG